MIKMTVNELIHIFSTFPNEIIAEGYTENLTESKGLIYQKSGDKENGMCYDKFISNYGNNIVLDWDYKSSTHILTIAIKVN